jgi:hypothetical protein
VVEFGEGVELSVSYLRISLHCLYCLTLWDWGNRLGDMLAAYFLISPAVAFCCNPSVS